MKTKFFFVVCLLFCMALFQVQAQHGKNVIGSVSYNADGPGFFLIEVNGELVDYFYGFVTYHYVDHYANGIMVDQRYMDHQVLTSEMTGKTYRTNEVSLYAGGTLTNWEGILPWTGEWGSIWVMDPLCYCLDTLICDDGTVYIIRFVYSFIDALNGGSDRAGITNYECRVAGKK